MLHGKNVVQYRKHLTQLSYPEYALHHTDSASSGRDSERVLNLALWNDAAPPGVAEAAMHALSKSVGAYSFAQDTELISLLAKQLDTSDDMIIITAGADDALRVASQYCIRPATKTLIPVPCFGRYAYHAMIQQANISYLRFDTYPYEFDIVKIRDVARKKKIACLYIASPNNPTGHALDHESLRLLLTTVSCAVILDESLVLSTCGTSSIDLIREHQNLFICSSFSKLYGLAGLRIGYIVANPMHTKQLRKLVSPFGVDGLGLEIAKYMVKQESWLRERISEINGSIAMLRGLEVPRLRVTHTSAPVALIEYAGTNSLHRMLYNQGISTVAGNEFPGLDKTNTVRVIIKNMSDAQQLTRVLAAIS